PPPGKGRRSRTVLFGPSKSTKAPSPAALQRRMRNWSSSRQLPAAYRKRPSLEKATLLRSPFVTPVVSGDFSGCSVAPSSSATAGIPKTPPAMGRRPGEKGTERGFSPPAGARSANPPQPGRFELIEPHHTVETGGDEASSRIQVGAVAVLLAV